MSAGITPEDMAGMLRREIEYRLNEIVGKEIKAAQERIDRAIRDELGRIVLAVASEYHMQDRGNYLEIRVKNTK